MATNQKLLFKKSLKISEASQTCNNEPFKRSPTFQHEFPYQTGRSTRACLGGTAALRIYVSSQQISPSEIRNINHSLHLFLSNFPFRFGRQKMKPNMNSRFFIFLIFTSTLANSISAFPLPHFFPNISSIPKSLIPNATDGAWDSFRHLFGCHAGQKADGLARLKQYFHYFGYINSSAAANFTDDFDDALKAAIRTYQLNFNLNTTGELDLPTLTQIVRPRCGVADVINGTSSMNSGKDPPPPAGIHAVAHYTFFPGTPRWPESKRDLTYAFSPDNQLSDAVRAVFSRAFTKWSDVIPMTFTETSSYYAADIRIGFYTGDHGDGEPFDGVLGTLAHAFSPTSGRFHLDAAENWVVDGDVTASTVASAVDLESVAVHEIGHLLGLGHSSVEESIMYPTISSRTRKVELESDDIQGIQELYGSNPNYTGSSPSTNQENESSGGRSNFVGGLWGPNLLLAVGFVVLAL